TDFYCIITPEQKKIGFPPESQKEVAKKELTQADSVVVPPSDDNKTESSTKVPISSPETVDEEQVLVYEFNPFYLVIPDNVANARDVSVNIERKRIRIIFRQNGDETVYFDRDLYWDIHKDDAIWTFDAKENQVSHKSVVNNSSQF
ncbi:unnamed protein product, partial [Trichobilharzia regenti]